MKQKTAHPYPLWHPVYWLATWFHSGLFPKAPGTVGTLAALPFAWVIYESLGSVGLLIASILAFFVGWYVSSEYVKKTGREDPKEVVIDEVAGMWLVISATPISHINPDRMGVIGGRMHSSPFAHWVHHEPWSGVILLVCAFILFRLFDIWKPWPISWCDRKIKGGLGIMLDDILAAIAASGAMFATISLVLWI